MPLGQTVQLVPLKKGVAAGQIVTGTTEALICA